MYQVPNDMSHPQLLESMSAHIMKFNNSKSQQLRNKYAVSVAYGKKISNDIPLPSFDSRMSHQRRTEILNVQAIQISKNTLATKFPLILEGEYHQFVTSKPRVSCQLCMCNERDMENRMTRAKKRNSNQN